MLTRIAAFLAGIVFATSTAALATGNRWINLRSGDQADFQAVLCTTNGPTHAVACALSDRNWYTVALSLHQVAVLDKAGQAVFYRRR